MAEAEGPQAGSQSLDWIAPQPPSLLGDQVYPASRPQLPGHWFHSQTWLNLRRYSGALRRYQAQMCSN